MKKKRDAYGGNGDIYFSDDNLTATKILRNKSTSEKINRFKREVEVMKSLAKRNIPYIVEVFSVELDEVHPENSKIVMRKYDGYLSELIDVTRGNVRYTLKLMKGVTILSIIILFNSVINFMKNAPNNLAKCRNLSVSDKNIR